MGVEPTSMPWQGIVLTVERQNRIRKEACFDVFNTVSKETKAVQTDKTCCGIMAGEKGIEPNLSLVLETIILPLNYSPIKWRGVRDLNSGPNA